MQKIKTGDKVVVMSGKDKGREGTVERVFPKKGTAFVPGINIYKKHIKKQMAADNKGGVYEIPRPIALSKLMVVDPKTNKPTRVGFKIEGGKKLRFSKKSGVILDQK